MIQDLVIKSYVWHSDKCFFVSTIERDSSAAIGPTRFNETIVWAYNWDNGERAEMISTHDDSSGSIRTHQRICDLIYRTGKTEEEA